MNFFLHHILFIKDEAVIIYLTVFHCFIQQQEAYSKLGGTSEIVIRVTDSCANTAVHKAAQAGNIACLQWLVGELPNDCVRNITNQDYHTPLAIALKV